MYKRFTTLLLMVSSIVVAMGDKEKEPSVYMNATDMYGVCAGETFQRSNSNTEKDPCRDEREQLIFCRAITGQMVPFLSGGGCQQEKELYEKCKQRYVDQKKKESKKE